MKHEFTLSPNQLWILKVIATYFCVSRSQINRYWYPKDDGSLVRKCLRKLVGFGFLRRTHMEVVNPSGGRPIPVYSPTEAGKDYLLSIEPSQWHAVCTRTPNWQYLRHLN